MQLKTPDFWSHRGFFALLLWPLSLIWRLGHSLRWYRASQYQASLPVICVGNLSIGGTGKTPTVLRLAGLLAEMGYQPVILSRGYGGAEKGPILVNPEQHSAADIGDEPLMMAASLPVVVSRRRDIGARYIEHHRLGDIILMDDGLQNPDLFQDIVLGVFDGEVGIGNNLILPAGPMREPFKQGVKKLDIALVNGTDETGLSAKIGAAGSSDLLCISAVLNPSLDMTAEPDTSYIAFAGIGRPSRFFKSLQHAGFELVQSISFADHHPYANTDLIRLQEAANQSGAQLITTMKDWVRLPPEWRAEIKSFVVSMDFGEDEAKLRDRLEGQLEKAMQRCTKTA